MVDKHTINKNYPQKKKKRIQKTTNDMPTHMKCKCGGGETCIVDRRWMNYWVNEDGIFQNACIPTRKHCLQKYLPEQEEALQKYKLSYNKVTPSIYDRWNEDSLSGRM